MDERQEEINQSIVRAFEALQRLQTVDSEMQRLLGEGFRSVALQGDRYDAELAEIRDGLAALDYRLKVVEHGGQSVAANVRPFRCVPDESGGLRDDDGD